MSDPACNENTHGPHQKFQSRAQPSKERYQYLLHINDCRQSACDDTSRNKNLLDEISRGLELIVAIIDKSAEADLLQKLKAEIEGDLEHTTAELVKMGEDIEKLRREVSNVRSGGYSPQLMDAFTFKIEAISNLQSRMPTMITILAATYVPLAFVTVNI